MVRSPSKRRFEVWGLEQDTAWDSNTFFLPTLTSFLTVRLYLWTKCEYGIHTNCIYFFICSLSMAAMPSSAASKSRMSRAMSDPIVQVYMQNFLNIHSRGFCLSSACSGAFPNQVCLASKKASWVLRMTYPRACSPIPTARPILRLSGSFLSLRALVATSESDIPSQKSETSALPDA